VPSSWELDVLGVGAGEADGLGDLIEGLLAAGCGACTRGGGRRRREDVDAVGGCGLDGAGAASMSFRLARARRDTGALDLASDGLDGVEVTVEAMANPASGRRPGGRDLMGHAELFLVVLGAAGGCSPSRRVVSKKTMCLGSAIGLVPFDLAIIITQAL